MVGTPKEKETRSKQKSKDSVFRGKLERRKSGWIHACPQCLSINLRPKSSISGILVQSEWICLDCGFTGVAIEVRTEDIEELQRIQLAEPLSHERSTLRGKNWNLSNRKRRQKE